ncbi:MAG: tetratricopeptide repeat protein [Bacteroidota bacterium]|jgi:tetratricopeptide (TPR) repeat protein|nr:tetratricopeptide repeat protein [Bacteroidota bacterium]
MMGTSNTTCSACGSIKPDGHDVCDICGHDARTDARTPSPAAAPPRPDHPAEAPVRKQGRGNPRSAGSRAKKTGTSGMGAALFSTPQWIAITVAAFILGGVLAATIVSPGGRSSTGSTAEQQASADGVQPDMQRLTETRAAMEANPDNPDALLAYSHALHDSGMPAQAIVQYKRYLEFRPDDPDARVDLGICYFETKDYATAITEMERAVAKSPDHQLGNYNLGIVNLNAGNKDKAREWFEKARDLDPSTPHGQNAAQLLREHF